MVSNNILTKKRIDWVDMAKGYGTIAVIFAHLAVGKIGVWLYTFHVPLFFFLSGYVFNESLNFNDFISKKGKGILIPYFTLGLPMIAFTFLQQYRGSWLTREIVITLLKEFIFQKRLWTLWFIACLFFVNIFFYFIRKFIKSDLLKFALSVVLVCIGIYYYRCGGQPLPWNIDVCFTATVFFCGGYLLKKHGKYFDYVKNKRALAVILFFLLGIANVIFGYLTHKISGNGMEMFYSTYGFPPFTFISAFTGIFAVVIFSTFFTLKPIKYIGENSLFYYAWHQTILIPIVDKIFIKLGLFDNLIHLSLNYYIIRAAQTILIIMITTVITLVINKTKLKILFGKK